MIYLLKHSNKINMALDKYLYTEVFNPLRY